MIVQRNLGEYPYTDITPRAGPVNGEMPNGNGAVPGAYDPYITIGGVVVPKRYLWLLGVGLAIAYYRGM